MHITKMHGLGNDYIYLNGLEGAPEDLPGLAVRLSDRHFGVGGDGVICIRPGRGGDFTMEMYNADGSRGAMCGNGIRCVGNPHGVVFCPAPEAVPLERVGPILEGSGAFPQRINVEFAAARTRERLEARVWERGSGITLACGTGACAVLAAAVRTGRCGRRAAVRLPGGVLELDWDRDSGHIWMTGPAVTVFEGEVD